MYRLAEAYASDISRTGPVCVACVTGCQLIAEFKLAGSKASGHEARWGSKPGEVLNPQPARSESKTHIQSPLFAQQTLSFENARTALFLFKAKRLPKLIDFNYQFLLVSVLFKSLPFWRRTAGFESAFHPFAGHFCTASEELFSDAWTSATEASLPAFREANGRVGKFPCQYQRFYGIISSSMPSANTHSLLSHRHQRFIGRSLRFSTWEASWPPLFSSVCGREDIL